MTSTDDYKITKEEAFCFLQDVLKITSPETKLKANKVSFLEELIKAMHHHVPYQTIKGISVPPANRRLPTAMDIKTDIMSKMGGLCYQINIFCWMLLCALEFDAYLAPGDGLNYIDLHVAVVVKDLTKEGSKHLVEVGTGYPTFRLLPLDFIDTSQEYSDSYLRYRFARQGEMVVLQYSADSNPSEVKTYRDFIKDGWVSFNRTHIDQPVSVSYFDRAMTGYLTVVSELFLLTSMRCLAYPNGRLVCIKDSKLLLEDEDHQVQVTPFRSHGEMMEAFARYFPQFPEDMIKAAAENVHIDFQKK